MSQAVARYALRIEISDGSLLEARHHMSRKADAISAARRAAKDTICEDIIKIHVDDTKTGFGVVSFETRSWIARRKSLLEELSK